MILKLLKVAYMFICAVQVCMDANHKSVEKEIYFLLTLQSES